MFDNQAESLDWIDSQTIVEETSPDFLGDRHDRNDPLSTEVIQSQNLTPTQFATTSENNTIAITTDDDRLTGIFTLDSLAGLNTGDRYTGQC